MLCQISEKWNVKKILLLFIGGFFLFINAIMQSGIAAPSIYYDEQSFLSSNQIVNTNDFEHLYGNLYFKNPFVDQGVTYTAGYPFSVFVWRDESNGSYNEFGLMSNNVEKNTLTFGDDSYVESVGLSITPINGILDRSGQWVITLIDLDDNLFTHYVDWTNNGPSSYRGFFDPNGIKLLSVDYDKPTGNSNFSIDIVSHSEIKVIGSQPPTTVSIVVTGGEIQECASPAGNEVVLSSDITMGEGTVLESISWEVDGNAAGNGSYIMPMLGLGMHDINLLVTASNNGVLEHVTASANVEIVDTTAPAIIASFVDSQSGQIVNQITTANVHWIQAKYNANDACDGSPITEGVSGFTVADGELLKIKGNSGATLITTDVLELSVSSADSSGNTASETIFLNITE